MKGKIYKIVNKKNGKVYVGQTKKTLEERFQRHCWKAMSKDDAHRDMAIKRAIVEFGRDSFSIELIEEVDIEKMNEREKFWITFYGSYKKGYNNTRGGIGGHGSRLSPDEEAEVIEAKYLGFSCSEIAEAYGIDKSSIYNIFKRHGLKMPNKRTLEDRIDMTAFVDFVKGGHSLKEIEERFGICRCSVYNFCRKHHIEYNISKSVRP